jgi:hypothetical protein
MSSNSKSEESINKEDKVTKVTEFKMILQLGDIIQIEDSTNEKLNEQTFVIDYIDETKIKIINVDSMETAVLKLDETGNIENETITNITVINRCEYPGYARQNDLVTGKWINIVMEADPPVTLTGEITNLEEDMIEVKTYPDNITIYINFDYKGFPEDLNIQDIQIREKPVAIEEEHMPAEEQSIPEMEVQNEVPSKGTKPQMLPNLETDVEPEKEPLQTQPVAAPVASVKDQLREIILKGNQIKFLNEYIGPIQQYKNVSEQTQRYSLETQTADLLDELLSTIPNIQRTSSVMNNIHTMIERFVQLRETFSIFNEYGNVEAAAVNEATFKPLVNYLKKFNENLYWILPVVKTIKKIYVDTSAKQSEENGGDILFIEMDDDIRKMNHLIETFKSNSINDEQNKYYSLYSDLNSYFTPFEYLTEENADEIISEARVRENINAIIDNLTQFNSSVMTNNGVKSRAFVMQKYNVGLDRLEIVNSKGSRMISKTVKLTNPDTLLISSIMTLPEPAIRFSRINLKTASILERANLNQTFINYWQLLKKNTYVQNIPIDTLGQEIEFNENNFANNIKNFSLDIPKEDAIGLTRKQIYKNFASSIVPKTKVVFHLMKKYIIGKLSIIDVVNYLEPFLVYSDNLTYMQYVEITKFIKEKIAENNKRFIERSRIFMSLKRPKGEKQFYSDAYSIINMLDNKQHIQKNEIFEAYDFFDIESKLHSNSEILRRLTLFDNCKLYTSVLSLQNIPLMFPSDFLPILDNEKQKIDARIKQDSTSDACKNVVIAKMYSSDEELKRDDNNDNIYFDKKYDTTDYGFIDSFEKEMIEKTPEDFISFLINKIKEKKKYNDEEAEYLADTLINGYKRVMNGQYAILHEPYNPEKEYSYYVRNNKKWEFDPNVDPSLISDSQNILCNLQDKCIAVPSNIDDKCESTSFNELQLQQTTLKNVMNEFDTKYAISKQEYEQKISALFEYNIGVMPILLKMRNDNLLKYNNFQYKLGEKLEKTVSAATISPYSKLKNIIMGQQDFVKKQYDILKFAQYFTRRAITTAIGPLGEYENEHWLYCIKTNVKLMPMFIYLMASAYIKYINDNQKYNEFVDLMIQSIGAVLNADGDAWVDIHSGEEIKKIALNEDEGYEDGFKVTSHAVLEKDISIPMTQDNFKKYDTVETMRINNIVNAISVSMGINIETQKEFIMSCVMEKIKESMPTEKDYTKQIKDMANKGKSIPSYEDLYSASVLYYTLGMILISIQTMIPSIKTKKTFPGCVRAFSGYPFEGAGDLSSLKYLACVAYKIRSSTKPWNVLNKKKETFIESKIKETIDGTDKSIGLIAMPEVRRKIDEKLQFLILNPDENSSIPEEHNILNWTQFLPPLIPIKIKQLLDISSEFKERLQSDLKTGSKEQREKILVVESKIIFFSLGIQERIHHVLKTKHTLLHKASNVPYIENACCNENGNITTLQYFEKEDSSISEYNKIVKRLTNIMNDITFYSKPSLLHSPFNTKNIYPSISYKMDEETIYLAFIRFCNFRNFAPIQPDLLLFCANKPETIKENDTLIEIIRKLKEERREFTEPQFLRLLQIVSRKNTVQIITDKKVLSSISKFSKVIEAIDEENDTVVNGSIRELLTNCLDTYDVAGNEITHEIRVLNNKLHKDNESIKAQLISFIKDNKGRTITSSNIRDVTAFITNIGNWDTDKSVRNENVQISNDSLYNIVNFFKTFIQNMVSGFPNIILNKVDYKNVQVPNYWGLSMHHSGKIRNFISDYYEELSHFYDIHSLNNILSTIQTACKNVLFMANNSPSFTSIKKKEEVLKPIFDEKTSKMLFEHYLLLIFEEYMNLSDMDEMIVTETQKPVDVLDIFSVNFLEEEERKASYKV